MSQTSQPQAGAPSSVLGRLATSRKAIAAALVIVAAVALAALGAISGQEALAAITAAAGVFMGATAYEDGRRASVGQPMTSLTSEGDGRMGRLQTLLEANRRAVERAMNSTLKVEVIGAPPGTPLSDAATRGDYFDREGNWKPGALSKRVRSAIGQGEETLGALQQVQMTRREVASCKDVDATAAANDAEKPSAEEG
ncbi:MAG: hypothetical protein ACTHU0_21870 [Kofleriaceae bacterium]